MDRLANHGAGTVEITALGDRTQAALIGRFGIEQLPEVQAHLATLAADDPVTFDLSRTDRIDTSIAWAILETEHRLPDKIDIAGANPETAQVLDLIRKGRPQADPRPVKPHGLRMFLTRLGEKVAQRGETLASILGLLGLFIARLGQSVIRPRNFRLTALVHHCEDVGLRAVPIVALMAFLIGVVLAFQGSSQLRQFGAEVFVVDLIAISVLRELGVLLTAIIVAGRTASSFTAAIGSMKMREEIDAMQTLGIDPAHALVVPRILALILMLPILTLVANAAGLFGGALMSWIELGISPAMFTTRLIEGTDISHVFVGVVKAPVFAILIGVIGCEAGLAVGGTTESLGRKTSAAVVAAIFAVILADALFSIFFQQMGI
ncbi:MlaE family lipid ABC transporter permease subunit [Aestuariibius sp. 2305UL40-4]|uniref:MlaE family lipid ABC transporter permease subunit n=1 Tax=Aestuariibius violaceus TaxID=3234132 RepID=UPI00345E6FF2